MVSAVALTADGCAAEALSLTRERTIAEMQEWCDRQQAAGYRVVALPFTPEVGVVVTAGEVAADDCGQPLGCLYDPLCERHRDPTPQEMVRQLDAALHGTSYARPTSPSVVWRDLLGEVVELARQTEGAGHG